MSTRVGGGFSTGFSFGFAVVQPVTSAVFFPLSATASVVFIPNVTSATFKVLEPDTEISDLNWDDCQPNLGMWNKFNDCHDNESEMFDGILQDAYNTAPVPINYYVTDYNVDYDKIFGEDNDRNIVRTFKMNAQYDLPSEDENLTINGIEGIDTFKVNVSMKHFTSASTYDENGNPNIYSSYKPKAGDVFQAEYNGMYYEILHVKKTINQFLQRAHSWEFAARRYRDIHFSLSSSTSADSISAFTDQKDYLEINDFIDTSKQSIIITSANDVANGREPPNDPFGGW